MDKEIAVNLPYPSLDCITKDLCAAQVISPAYAGRHGELNAILQYVYHHYYFSEEGNEQTANVLIGISALQLRYVHRGIRKVFQNRAEDAYGRHSGRSRRRERIRRDA